MEEVYGALFGMLQAYGYLGAFIISVLGSVIPFLPVPYLIPIVLMARILDPFILGIVSGAGGALGKITSYLLGRFGRRFLSEERRKKTAILGEAIKRYGMIAVFLFALTPLPDDVIYIPVGLTGLSILRFMIANMLGKIVLSWIVAYAGRLYFDLASLFLGEGGGLEAVIIAMAAMIAITILLLRVDWEEVIKIAREKGSWEAFKLTLSFMGIRRRGAGNKT
ncbi:MAG: VTT domain-containing protein [Thaumarchaeota archaeon]|nr:VTT domain-containing protein [Nitrososphaerota archaeon]